MKGVFFTVQKAISLMPKGSAIVLNASINAHLGMPGTTVYGASKAGVVNLAKTLSAELLEKGIRVNVVAPGRSPRHFCETAPRKKFKKPKIGFKAKFLSNVLARQRR